MAKASPGCQCYEPEVECCGEKALEDGLFGKEQAWKCPKCGKRWTIYEEIRAVEVLTVSSQPTGKLTPGHFKHVPPKPGECLWWDWCTKQRQKGNRRS